MTVCHQIVATLAMLCLAGPQAAFLLALLILASRRYPARCEARNESLVRYIHAGPDGLYRLYRGTSSPGVNAADATDGGDIRSLQQYWQGPWWFTLVLRDPYFPHSRPDILTVWSFGQPAEAWRRFSVLLQAARWANEPGAPARMAI